MRAAFVGRENELGELVRFLDGALDGHPAVVLCRGEPGIGKTRLAEELTEIAADRGCLTAWGVAVESDAPPYWPWRQILRELPAAAADPDLGGLIGGQSADAGTPSSEDRFRQFDAVGRLIGEAAADNPVVIVLDDAHWADRPSVLLVQHFARAVRDQRVLLVANHRDTEHEHAALFADLIREPITHHIDLRGLTTPAVAVQLASVVGREIDPRDAEQVHALTGGNPFFVGEVGRVLPAGKVAGGLAPVTANVREAIRSRLNRVSPGAGRFTQAASIIGREFAPALAAAMMGAATEDGLRWLDEAVAAGLIETTPAPDRYRFVHALIRDAIEATLSTPDRVALHRSAAETIESLHAPRLGSYLSDLARHWTIATVDTDRARAVHWNELAADDAMRTLAYEEAARLYAVALRLGDAELEDAARCRLLLGLARAQNGFVDIAGCLDSSVRAADLAERLGRTDLLADAALLRGAIGPTASEAATLELCDRALAAVEPDEDALRARLLARRTEASVYSAWVTSHGTEEYELAARSSADALSLAERSGDAAALDAALRARRLARSGPDGLSERAQLADRMVALGAETGNAGTQMWAHLWHIDAAFERGDLRRVARELEDLARCVDRVRGPHARYELYKCRAVLAQAQARFADAMRIAEEAFTQLTSTGDVIGFHERAGLLHQIGLHIGHDASRSLEASGYQSATVFEHELPTAGVIVAIANAHMLGSLGRLDEAAAVYTSLGPAASWQPSPHAILPAFAFGIGLAIALGLRDDVDVLRERLATYRGHHIVSGAGQVAYFGPVELALGRAAAYLGRSDEAVADLDAAVHICATNGAAGYDVEACCELAAALVDMRETGRARALLDTVKRRASELGMAPFAARAEALLRDLTGSGPLTAREWEVAELVAKGMTNREIAETLFLSERTAQNHVQHVLTKLGLSNRSQIAVWVAREYSG